MKRGDIGNFNWVKIQNFPLCIGSKFKSSFFLLGQNYPFLWVKISKILILNSCFAIHFDELDFFCCLSQTAEIPKIMYFDHDSQQLALVLQQNREKLWLPLG